MSVLQTYSYQILASIFFGSILLYRQFKAKKINPNGLPLPPGPKGYPLIGAIFDMPIHKPWLVYDAWVKKYGKSMIIDSIFQRFTFLLYRWYGIFHCPWQQLFGFGLLWTDQWLAREEVFKFLRQTAVTNDHGVVCIKFLASQILPKKLCFRMNWEANFGLLPYGVSWRKHRRTFHQYFNIDAVTKYRPIQRREVHSFLRRLLATPEDFLLHIRQ